MSNTVETQKKNRLQRDLIEGIIVIAGLFLTVLLSIYSYLLFHSTVEVISIVISGGIFFIGWNSRKFMNSSFFLIIGISFFFMSIIDLVHTLSFSGLGIFVNYDANLATQFWIVARYWQSLSYPIGLIAINRKIKSRYIFGICLVIITVLFYTLFTRLFPICYIEGTGLTPFKIISEYVIILILIFTLYLMYRNKKEFSNRIFNFTFISVCVTITSELAFTFYGGVYDFFNLFGHIFKIVSFFFIYKAVIETGLENPYGLLFRKLKMSDDSLRQKAHDLEQAYSEFNQVFNASLPLRIINKDREILSANDTYVNLFQLYKDEIKGMKCYDHDLIHLGHHCDTDKCSMKQIEEGKEFYEYELASKLPDGTNLVNIIRSVPYKDAEGNFAGIIQNFTNITERSKIERDLIESEEKYRTLVEDSIEGIWVVDTETNTTFVNQSMANMFGYEISEMIGKSMYVFMDENDRKSASDKFQSRKNGIKEDHEFEFLHKSGKKVYTSLRASPIFGESGTFNGAMAFVTDITIQKIAQEKIADMAKFPFENPNPVLRLSKSYVLLANTASQKLFNIGEGSRIPEVLKKSVKKAFSEREHVEMEVQIKENTYNLFIVPIKGAGYANIYGMDITGRKKAEKSLERFVSTVSHELRTPVSILTMSIEFLKNHSEKITPEISKKLEEGISRNIYLLQDLIEDILTLSRIDEGRAKLELSDYNPRKILTEILSLMEPIGKEKNVTFKVDVDKTITLNGDYKKIDQIFRIFIDNAIKYSKESNEIEITAINHYNGKYNNDNKEGVLFLFKDIGIGIAEGDLSNLFQRFFRSESVSDIPGTGLGLSIAKELIKLHEGDFFVESALGEGTTFFVFLPMIK